MCTKGTIRLADGPGSTTPTPFDYPARLPSTSPSPPSFPPAPREAGPGANWTPLSQSGALGSLRQRVLTQEAGKPSLTPRFSITFMYSTGVSTSGWIFQPSPVDSGYQGSPLLSRSAASKQHQSRLRVMTSAGKRTSRYLSFPVYSPILKSNHNRWRRYTSRRPFVNAPLQPPSVSR
jgi:hypothetical protein